MKTAVVSRLPLSCDYDTTKHFYKTCLFDSFKLLLTASIYQMQVNSASVILALPCLSNKNVYIVMMKYMKKSSRN